jgi:transcriptional regulator with GAF, ATPase, and Fis domain
MEGDEEKQLRSVAVQTASSIFVARQRAEHELVRVREAFDMLRQAMAQMAAASNPDDLTKVLEVISNSLVEQAGMDGAMISLWITDDRCPICRSHGRTSPGSPPMLHSQTYVGGDREGFLRHHRVPAGYGTVGYAINTRQPLLVNELQAISRARLADPIAPLGRLQGMETPEAESRWVLEHGYESTAVYPLIAAGGQVVGVLTIVAKRPIGDDEFAHLGVFAHQATVSIRDAQMLEELTALRDQLLVENAYLQKEIESEGGFDEMIGRSPALAGVRKLVAQVAPTDSTVLVLGETGTGKELVARAIHRLSPRRNRPLIKVNCGAISPTLIESELFGHEKGAFTGALQRRVGRFELAHGGTIFLDEVGELPPEAQVKLLRVLQEQEFERVGGTQTIRSDVRVIAATNRDLQEAVREKSFRADLFYRLNVFPLDVPALRHRQSDVALLVEHFVDRFAKRAGKRFRGLGKGSLELLQSYDWPGNIRELQNLIERAVITSDSGAALSIDERWLSVVRSRQPEGSKTLVASEKEAIETALAQAKGRVSGPLGAAVKLGVPSSTLESKIKALGIDKRLFKPGPSIIGS